ncbi:chemotaxis protein CheW [Pseudomonas gingeri]|uniref:Chemotaxis protein CheW n=1 Tax=Pseudomonas gingeri TaxID=117681 RepID=A0A7Y7YGE6_9PSED|nr:chemotaxis protein CheW [Pseudomonas gingeri]NWB31347.1 chemotaxis protein CheW [Pseudomonas gingeri]NWC35788.1 chemotaxis protein CheW [Pseudomonas gingeri]NWD06332.1 chemotaxis protein CheW [Pseudomonas gingeri]NWE32829.1 chemotaxis protein CheW [Pseudomonas gingeri]NWE60442.1 chemotaxis protein CheW [Pseudomonas gingeri]
MSESISLLHTPRETVPTQYLTFRLGQEMFAVSTLSVREIVEYGPITALPLAPPSIRGVTNLRGAAIAVLDLGVFFGGTPTQQSPRSCIVMLETRGASAGLMGIIVDAVSEVLEIPLDRIEPAPDLNGRLNQTFVLGIGKLDGGFVLLLDIERLLGADDGLVLQSPVALTQGLAS